MAWKHFAGRIESSLVIEPGAGDTCLSVPLPMLSGVAPEESDSSWGFAPRLAELEGGLRPLQRDHCTTYAQVLAGEPGLQKIEFESGFSKQTKGGEWQHCVGRCFAWRHGAWAKVWETEPIHYLFQPLPQVGDFDGDGSPEVAVLPFHELLILNARTGQIKDRCRFTDTRSYGFFGVYDLDGDGKTEFVIQADFSKHVEVLGYRDGKLALLWQQEIEVDISDPHKVLRVGPRPVADVDGDHKPEILVNLYNGTGDERWHITIHEAMTGALKADLVDEYLDGLLDVDGDGVAELLTTRTVGNGVPAYGPIRVRTLRGGVVATIWEQDGVGWQTWEPPLPENVMSTATFGTREVLQRTIDGRTAIVLRQPVADSAGEFDLSLAIWDAGGFREVTSARGPQLEALALDATGRLLARCRTCPRETATITVRGGSARVLSSWKRGVERGSAVVARAGDGKAPVVLVQGDDEEMVAFQALRAGQPPVELWRRHGRAQSYSWPQNLGPVWADLLGDGERRYLYATAAPTGCARLVAAALDGEELWHHDFPRIPGTAPVWNSGGVLMWQTGHLTDRQTLDVLVTIRRSMMHSEEVVLLSGRDGRELWHRDRQISQRGVGGTPFAIADLDGDGLDDVASLHPNILYTLKGSTGQDLVARLAAWEGVPAESVYWGQPIAGEWLGDGQVSLYFANPNGIITGVIRPDGTLAWWDALETSPKSLPALGDLDGDGRLEAVGVGYEDGIRCYDAASGRVKWRMPAPAGGNPVGAASADVDGDGRDEALFVIDRTLYCLGASSTGDRGILLWQIELPARVGPPSIAQLDGEGQLTILLVGEDGYVYGVR